MDDHSFVAASVWEFLDPEPFIASFLAAAEPMVLSCAYDRRAHVFEMTCSSFHRRQVRDLFVARFRAYVRRERARAAATEGDVIEQQPLVRKLIEAREIPRDFYAEARAIYEAQQRQPQQGAEDLVAVETQAVRWVPQEAATDVAYVVFSAYTLQEIAAQSGCEVEWHHQFPPAIEIKYPNKEALALAQEALMSFDQLYAPLNSNRTEFDLCYDDAPRNHQFRFIVPEVTLDSELCCRPNFYREFHEAIVARWDSVSLQFRTKPRDTQLITYPDGSFCPWVGAGGFPYGRLPSNDDDWLSPADEQVRALEFKLARSRIDDQQRNIVQWTQHIVDGPEGSGGRAGYAEAPQIKAIEDIPSTPNDAVAEAIPGVTAGNARPASQQPIDLLGDLPVSYEGTHMSPTEFAQSEPPSSFLEEHSWSHVFGNRRRRPEVIEAELQEAKAKQLGVEIWQLPVAGRAPVPSETSASVLPTEVLEDMARYGEQRSYHRETKLQAPSRRPRPPASSTRTDAKRPAGGDDVSIEQAREELHKAARVALTRILKLSLASHRCTQVNVDLFLGKLFVDSRTLEKKFRCRQGQQTAFFPAEDWGAHFAVPAGGPGGRPSGTAESIFSKRLCTTWDEVRAILDLCDSHRDELGRMQRTQLFDPRPSTQRSFYVLRCRNAQDESEAVIEIELDESAPTNTDPSDAAAAHAPIREPTKQIGPPPAILGHVNIHCPGQTWDMALHVTGSLPVDYATLPAFWPLHESVCVLPPAAADAAPGRVYAKSGFPGVQVVAVELRREKVHACRVGQGLALALTQVRRYRVAPHASGDGRLCAWEPAEAQVKEEGRLWWEAALRHVGLTECLRAPAGGAGGVGGVHAEFARLQREARAGGAVRPCLRNLLELGMFIVPRIDPVGNASYLFEKPSHEPTLAVSGTQAAPSARPGQPPPSARPGREPPSLI